ncbi:hypothetical protein COA08_23640 [Bacillus cereus]|uniref:Uncharacterized protein n=1 Tax=Bacillus cereus TaxID=1396 RepID=A0A2C0EIT0_BACCE|nr:hypothetical protein [Bacillus cereus]PGQ05946.1 hypothetical protein COA08_23640 [Bacillus cereus]
MSQYWYDNFKDNPDLYSGYCRKLCRSLGLSDFYIVKVLYFANLIHVATSKYDDVLFHSGIRFPSETFTWKLREANSKEENFDVEAFLEYASDLVDEYVRIDPADLRPSLLVLHKHVQSSSKFELFVINGDIFSFIDENSHLPGLFVITHEDEYLFVSEIGADPAGVIDEVVELKKKYRTFDLHIIVTETKSDAKLYAMYLALKYLSTADLNITLDVPEYSKSLKCHFENQVI